VNERWPPKKKRKVKLRSPVKKRVEKAPHPGRVDVPARLAHGPDRLPLCREITSGYDFVSLSGHVVPESNYIS